MNAAIHLFQKGFEHFAFRHPYLAYAVMFAGLPTCILLAVFCGTAAVAVPVCLLLGIA